MNESKRASPFAAELARKTTARANYAGHPKSTRMDTALNLARGARSSLLRLIRELRALRANKGGNREL